MYHCIGFLVLHCHILLLNARLNIERAEEDVFDNPNCKNLTGVGCDCYGLDAVCVNSTYCKRCKCSSPYKTFLSSNDTDNNGRCVKDRGLLFIPSTSNNLFLVQNTDCMRPQRTNEYYVKKTSCGENYSWKRWIWTQYNQLMHVDSLKCLQEDIFWHTGRISGNKYYRLTLGECNSTETKQLWQCLGQNNFRSKKLKLYMYQFSAWDYIYGTNGDRYSERIKWRRFPSNENLCSEAFGCYEFVKDSSAIFVTDVRKCDQAECLEEREISVPHKPGENLCFVMWETILYLDNDEWKKLSFRDEIFNVNKRAKKTFLKLNFRKATNNWTGLVVKLNFYCAEGKLNQTNTKVEYIKCVVIKFKGTAIYATTAPSTVSTTEVTETNPFTNSPTFTTSSEMSNTTSTAEKYKSDSSPVAIIVVCVVIAILIICGILGFIYYKRRRRPVVHEEGDTQPSEANMNPIYSPVDDKPTPFFSGNEERYQEPQTGASRECELYESSDNHVYDSADVEQNGKHVPHVYDYAKSDVRPVGQGLLRDADGGDISRSPVESKKEDSYGNEKTGHELIPVYETLQDTSVDK